MKNNKRITIYTPSIGDVLFETIKIVNGKPISLEHHFNRITAGLDALKINYDNSFNLKMIHSLFSKLISNNV